MKVIETDLSDCLIIEPTVFNDERGYFMESFNERQFNSLTGNEVHFVQDNQSFSTKGVLRGLHYQTGRSAQTKLVRVLTGEVLDVAVDLRGGSATFGKYFSVVLSAQNQKQLFIPRGFAHGFLVLSETATLFYKCDNYYDAGSEGGVRFDDETLNINWNVSTQSVIISGKDLALPKLSEAKIIW